MLHHDLSLGWTAWRDFWSAKAHATQRLQRSANHLRTPLLTQAFVWWLRDWQQETAAVAQQQAAVQMAAVAGRGSHRCMHMHMHMHAHACTLLFACSRVLCTD